LQKFKELFRFLKSSAPFIKRNLRDVGEVSGHKFESLRSLIQDIEMFLDMINAVENSFEILLLRNKL